MKLTHPIKYTIIICIAVAAAASFFYFQSGFLVEVEQNFASISQTAQSSLISRAKIFRKKPKESRVIQNASLQLTPNQTVVGSEARDVQTTIMLEAKNRKIAGVDIVITYEPLFVAIDDIAVADTMETVALKKIDAENGRIYLSLMAQAGGYIEGNHALATILWHPLTEGDTSFAFDYTPGLAEDTNVAEFATGNDVLTSVVNARYAIRGQ
ncbi:MAG: hypothetical protein A2249_04200 [Candidatus Jacksonbacteria bacterium RIFOXYA2_FULL_44_7]|uniref:Cohesin domain-containing protein n=1 Tax=Candidatus Jacksonbacteria bacterium RIFCSPLOWO2_02_FULL_44_20 TaxID=1798460 RepID=A0A1G2ACD1_9BACT|nr:MAG: hypothetical protein UW39_C0031G0011 [Parcubacteria group bacterium GW2011_GWC2_44_17]OGY70654.1 MAG: hypothetical protein A3C00_02000 [Candidatus Jacksonbacteria bacterium RIFCSPHIGHO2_02_FULL_44_25]OGY74146.1 MAG: hypothetical protein A3H61_04415 [Candidatus Jacksonbacteria bacterium RIFCSPLOWO2_02_FULL_44_20]OGY76158.1 MAG: hypothetical protein A2249_04200 [Candidatus Jacksonbacteria bacterium RIFOXYA2_FULL_44_7]HCE86806.1 hypothetical protein [Candidatus Jacksonbacteria bacterium]